MYLVSIHALLAECDCLVIIDYDRAIVSIHALLAECDNTGREPGPLSEKFQSTHSLRSATNQCLRP